MFVNRHHSDLMEIRGVSATYEAHSDFYRWNIFRLF